MERKLSLVPRTRELFHAFYRDFVQDPALFADMSLYADYHYDRAWVDARYDRHAADGHRCCLILLLGDTVISKTTFELSGSNTEQNDSVGLIKVSGHVKGLIEGYVDAEIYGVVRGKLSAVVDMGSVTELSESVSEKENDGGSSL